MEKECLPVPRLMSSSLFWEVFQRQPKERFVRDGRHASGYASRYAIAKFQSLMSQKNYSFQSLEGLRFALKIEKDKVSLFPASVLGCNFHSTPKGDLIDVSSDFSFSLDSLSENTLLYGIFECEIKGVRKHKSLVKLFPENLCFSISDVLEYQGKEMIFTSWERRMSVVQSLQDVHKWIQPASFLDFSASTRQQREFCQDAFSLEKKVVIKERSGIYEVLAQRSAQFRSLDLRSEFESTVLLCPSFLPALEKREISCPSFLEEVFIISESDETKKIKRAPHAISGVKLQSKKSEEIFSVSVLPFHIRKMISEKDSSSPILSPDFIGKTAWVENLDFGSTRWNRRLVAIEGS